MLSLLATYAFIAFVSIMRAETINCASGSSCASTTQTCQNDEECIFTCAANQGYCEPTTFNCRDGHRCTLNCNRNSCFNVVFNCPVGGECVLNAYSTVAFLSSTVNGADQPLIISCPDCGNWNFKQSTINCPTNAHCNITLGNSWSLHVFRQAIIRAQNSSLFYLNVANLGEVMNYATVYCPESNAVTYDPNNCIFHFKDIAKHTASTELERLKIYASGSFQDISFVCETSSNDTDPLCRGATMYCGLGGSQGSCEMERLRGVDVWNCIDSSSPCWDPDNTKDPSTHPTRYPSEHSTVPTTNPTRHPSVPSALPTETTSNPSEHTTTPTINPTHYPTTTPTKYQSLQPSRHPSLQPTRYPSVSPTNPTKYPSLQPTRYPSVSPTNPTKYPSLKPTRYPSLSPTNPTKYPSMPPTEYPTLFPSKDPTLTPTKYLTTSEVFTTGIVEDEMGTKPKSSLSIAAIVVLWVLACITVVVFVYCRCKKKQTIKQEVDVHVLQTQVNSNDEEEASMDNKTADVVGDVVLVTPDVSDLPDPPPRVELELVSGEDEEADESEELYEVVDDEYKWIKNILQSCDGTEWKMYLENFKRQKIMDSRLKLIQDGNDELWKTLIPEWGVRLEFQSLYKQQYGEDEGEGQRQMTTDTGTGTGDLT